MRRACLIVAAIGCGPTIVVEAEPQGTSAFATSTTGVEPDASSGTTTAVTDESTTDAAESTSSTSSGDEPPDVTNFIEASDAAASAIECDVWQQDCPLGEKCMPWASDDGYSWNATRCTSIASDPGQPGDACMVEGSGVSGIDTCEIAAMCWGVDPEINEGTCVAFCKGSEDDPICEEPGKVCWVANDGVLILCVDSCDPLVQDCSDGEACQPYGDSFSCAPECGGEMGMYGDPCDDGGCCDPGLICGDASGVPGCVASGCCTELCDLTEAELCQGEGQACVPLYEPGAAPPGYEHVGLCAVSA